jgi:hypothetical protein
MRPGLEHGMLIICDSPLGPAGLALCRMIIEDFRKHLCSCLTPPSPVQHHEDLARITAVRQPADL